jgi:hypothetical protein
MTTASRNRYGWRSRSHSVVIIVTVDLINIFAQLINIQLNKISEWAQTTCLPVDCIISTERKLLRITFIDEPCKISTTVAYGDHS